MMTMCASSIIGSSNSPTLSVTHDHNLGDRHIVSRNSKSDEPVKHTMFYPKVLHSVCKDRLAAVIVQMELTEN